MFMGVENPDSFVFVITWDSRDAHKAFKGSDRGRQAISSIVSYLVEQPTSTTNPCVFRLASARDNLQGTCKGYYI
jgi:quinol monooxygenase YgiN